MTDITQGDGQGDLPYRALTIQGLEFQVSMPYVSGQHLLTEGEASALNQTRAENLRNNFAPQVRKAMEEYRKANSLAEDAEIPLDALDKDTLDEAFEKYSNEYEFGIVRGGGPRAPTDPVQKEAYRIGLEKVKAALKKNSIKIDSVSKDKMDEMVRGVVLKYPEIAEEARRRVSAAGAIALSDLGL